MLEDKIVEEGKNQTIEDEETQAIEDEETQAIEYVSKRVLEIGMDEVVPIILAAMYPLVYIFGQLGRIIVEPYTVLLGNRESSFEKYVSIFEKRKNIRRLMDEIDGLSEAKRENERKRKKEARKNSEGSKTSNLWQSLKEFIP